VPASDPLTSRFFAIFDRAMVGIAYTTAHGSILEANRKFCEMLGYTAAELHRLTTPVSLDKTIGDDGDATLGDLMANGDGTPEDAVMALVDSELLDELLGTLDKRARYAIEARFGLLDGERKSFREVGENLGVTAEAARRLVSRAVAGLREDAVRILAA